MRRNFNLGIMGHVDAGKTSLARLLTTVPSTASLDKHPQSVERGMTIDLGFSCIALDEQQVQVTLVDCPGHSSLFKTVIGAANIIDAVLLVVDGNKGVQTQTAECLVLAELFTDRMIVAVNKTDTMTEGVDRMICRLRSTLQKTRFGNAPVIPVSAKDKTGAGLLLECIHELSKGHSRDQSLASAPFIMAIDHSFMIKGQGLIITGTILQGSVVPSDSLYLPDIRQCAKVKSIQSFRQSTRHAQAGDRVGMCLDGSALGKMERTMAVKRSEQPFHMTAVFTMTVNTIPHFKQPLTKQKFHISILHSTLLAKQVRFCVQHEHDEWQLVDHVIDDKRQYLAIVELDKPAAIPPNFLCVASRMDLSVKCCRLAFHGHIQQTSLSPLKYFTFKERRATVDRAMDGRLIGRGLVDKKGVLSRFLGMAVSIGGARGRISGPFGDSNKFNIQLATAYDKGVDGVDIVVRWKKYPLDPDKPWRQ